MSRLRNRVPRNLFALAAWMVLAASTHATIKLPPFFSDHMVLQSGRSVPVWGKADPGEKITVSLAGQTKTTEAGPDGKWSVALDPLSPGDPLTLTVQGNNSVTINDVLVGEVWLCAGQSNMFLPVAKAKDFQIEQPAATWPGIRQMQNGKWVICSPSTVGKFSATAYFFGREIHRKTGVPVGLLNYSSGGTLIELWTSLEAQKAVPELKPLFESNKEAAAAAASAEDAEQAKSDAAQATEVEGKKAVASAKVAPGYLFNDRIVPLAPYAIRGVIWYQGEANSYTVRANLYGIQLATMIKEWRKLWGYDFAFITVQLPDIGSPQTQPVQTHGRVLVREGELQSLSLPNTGLAVTIGTGEQKSNHPLNKQEVGRRLALWALATVYEKQDVPASGPLPESHKVAGDRVIVTFSHTDGGLVAQGGGELKGFAIAGADMKWVWGNATIDGNTVVVSSPEVKEPVAVRYAWAANPASSNLYNGAGLPATPFRTDNQPLTNAFRQ